MWTTNAALAVAFVGYLDPFIPSIVRNPLAAASLAVGMHEQGAVAGRTTSVNGACFILGPSIGVGLYQLWGPLPYVISAAALLLLLPYAVLRLKR